VLEEQVENCNILLTIIGPKWLSARDANGRRRLDNPADFVRVELAAALRRGIPVIPILLDGAEAPPAEQLPENIRELSRKAGLFIHHQTFDSDIDRLVQAITRLTGQRRSQTSLFRPKMIGAALVVLTVVAAATLGVLTFINNKGISSNNAARAPDVNDLPMHPPPPPTPVVPWSPRK
jgi:hypothetical protein